MAKGWYLKHIPKVIRVGGFILIICNPSIMSFVNEPAINRICNGACGNMFVLADELNAEYLATFNGTVAVDDIN